MDNARAHGAFRYDCDRRHKKVLFPRFAGTGTIYERGSAGLGFVPHDCRKVNAVRRIHAELFAFFNRAAIGSSRQWGNSMSRCRSRVAAFLKDESGATAIEYGLMAAGISVVILATLNTVGSRLNAKFDEISGLLQ
jgi:pilus assembly protein Flp/PilA